MADPFPVAGMKFYIGGVKATQATDFNSSDFASESWTEIDGLSTIGALGDNSALITTALVNRGRDFKQKGTSNAGSMQCTFAQISSDPGQIALVAASAASNKSNYAFRLTGNETGTPSQRYFVGLIMSAIEAGGEANTIRNLTTTIEVNSNVVVVPAS